MDDFRCQSLGESSAHLTEHETVLESLFFLCFHEQLYTSFIESTWSSDPPDVRSPVGIQILHRESMMSNAKWADPAWMQFEAVLAYFFFSFVLVVQFPFSLISGAFASSEADPG